MKILGIDPGLSGAVATVTWPGGALEVRRDFKTLGDIVTAVRELRPGCAYGVLELVSAMTGQGVCSMFSFGRATGVAMGSMFATDLEFVEVAPARWQNYWRLSVGWPDKEFDSRAVASQIWPELLHLFARKKDHGTADAALLAAYAASETSKHGVLETSRQIDFKTVGSRATIGAPGSPPDRSR